MNPEEKHYYQQLNPTEIPATSTISDLPTEQAEKSTKSDETNTSKTETEKVCNPTNVAVETVIPASRGQLPKELLNEDADKLLCWLARYPVERNHPRSLTGAINVKRSGEVLVLDLTDKLTDAFTKLVVEGFSSAPVIDNCNQYVGFIDLLDLAWFTLKSFTAYRENENLTDENQRDKYWNSFITTNQFKQATVAEVLTNPAWRYRNQFSPVYNGFSTLYPIEFMARTGLHRVPVLNKSNKVINILTQSMMMSLFDQSLHRFGSLANIRVTNMIPGLVQTIETIEENEITIKAYQKMVSKNITGLAVVNSSGVLVDTISVRDLRGIGLSADRYERLWLPVHLYKQRVREEFQIQTPPAPVTVTMQHTFTDVIKAMDDGNLHRIFVVQENEKGEKLPTHVIAQRDVLRFTLFRMGLDPKTIHED